MAKGSENTLLFLCTGNYYRSRFAEVLFNSVAGRMGLPWRATSRGLALERGVNNVGPMAATALTALEALGVRADGTVARLPAQLLVEDLEGADRVIALKRAEHLLFNTPSDAVRESIRGMKQKIEAGLARPGRMWGEVKLGEGSIRPCDRSDTPV